MNLTQIPFWKRLAGAGVCLLLIADFTACNRRDNAPALGPARVETAELAVTETIPAGPNDIYEDVTSKAGLAFVHQYCDSRIANIIESNGAGGAVLDYDQDGWPDIYLVNSGPLPGVTHHAPGTPRQPNRLYRNRGDGTFEDVTAKAGVAGHDYGTAAVAADYDNDGLPDLYVVNVGKNILYHNRGNGTFEDVTDKAGVGDAGTGISAVFLDVDLDGKLDLFMANYLTYDPNYNLYFNPDAYPGPLSYKPEFNVLYRNRGDGTFENVSEAAGIRIPGHRAMSVTAFDCDLDGDQDIYICNDATPNLLLVNDGKGHFQDRSLKAAVAFNALGEAAGSMAAAIGDCNGDTLPDILVTRLGYGSLYTGTREGVYDDRMVASGLGAMTAQYVGWGGNFLDFDNDGDKDIFIANGDAHHLVGWESLLLENKGDGNFSNARAKGGACFDARIKARGSAALDYDNNGKMDLLVTVMADRPFLLRNRDKSPHHWLGLDLEGTRSNRDGFGARVTITAGNLKQYQEARCPMGFLTSGDRRLHFGLGAAPTVQQIEIRWPSGKVQILTNLAVDRILKVREES
ncbi:MAG: CRTAC1 family protein [Chloroflexi bacterium]|nr:CRTAC1 family protein [Chloroflexota bacterium]